MEKQNELKINEEVNQKLVDNLLYTPMLANQMAFTKRLMTFKQDYSPELIRKTINLQERFKGRTEAILSSALARHQEEIESGTFTWLDFASSMLYHIAIEHPFIDGNKRTAINTALLMLMSNCPDLIKSEINFSPLENMVIEIVETHNSISEETEVDVVRDTLIKNIMDLKPIKQEKTHKSVFNSAKNLLENKKWNDLMRSLATK